MSRGRGEAKASKKSAACRRSQSRRPNKSRWCGRSKKEKASHSSHERKRVARITSLFNSLSELLGMEICSLGGRSPNHATKADVLQAAIDQLSSLINSPCRQKNEAALVGVRKPDSLTSEVGDLPAFRSVAALEQVEVARPSIAAALSGITLDEEQSVTAFGQPESDRYATPTTCSSTMVEGHGVAAGSCAVVATTNLTLPSQSSPHWPYDGLPTPDGMPSALVFDEVIYCVDDMYAGWGGQCNPICILDSTSKLVDIVPSLLTQVAQEVDYPSFPMAESDLDDASCTESSPPSVQKDCTESDTWFNSACANIQPCPNWTCWDESSDLDSNGDTMLLANTMALTQQESCR